MWQIDFNKLSVAVSWFLLIDKISVSSANVAIVWYISCADYVQDKSQDSTSRYIKDTTRWYIFPFDYRFFVHDSELTIRQVRFKKCIPGTWHLFKLIDEDSLVPDSLKSLGYVKEHSATVIFFFKSVTYCVSDAMDFINCRMFVAELKLIIRFKMFFFYNWFKTLK